MKKNQTIYPKCLFKDTPKAAYLTHDGYVRPCCYAHRHNKIEKDEPWMVELRHNLRSGNSLEKIFSTPEYKDFFERMKNGKDIPRRCIEVCSKPQDKGVDSRKEKTINGKLDWSREEAIYVDEYRVPKKLQVDVTHRCSLACSKCNRFIDEFKDHLSGLIYKTGHQVLNKVELSIEDFEKIFEENSVLHTQGDVDFTGTWSDAIYHPDFLAICRVIKKHGTSINISTNGSRRTKQFWEELFDILDPRLDTIVFGMDGLKDTADMYRKFCLYDDVVTAMKIGAEKGFKNNKWSFIVFNFNQHQTAEAQKIADDIGIKFELVKSHRWDGPDDPLMPSKEWLPQSVIEEYNL